MLAFQLNLYIYMYNKIYRINCEQLLKTKKQYTYVTLTSSKTWLSIIHCMVIGINDCA